MKIRTGFVSNSSSASFVLMLIPENVHDAVMEEASSDVHCVVGDLQSQGVFSKRVIGDSQFIQVNNYGPSSEEFGGFSFSEDVHVEVGDPYGPWEEYQRMILEEGGENGVLIIELDPESCSLEINGKET